MFAKSCKYLKATFPLWFWLQYFHKVKQKSNNNQNSVNIENNPFILLCILLQKFWQLKKCAPFALFSTSGDRWQEIGDIWQVTHDRWQVTHDLWHKLLPPNIHFSSKYLYNISPPLHITPTLLLSPSAPAGGSFPRSQWPPQPVWKKQCTRIY